MKIRRQISANARKKQLKVQHHKMNVRRQFFYNQMVNQVVNEKSSLESKDN